MTSISVPLRSVACSETGFLLNTLLASKDADRPYAHRYGSLASVILGLLQGDGPATNLLNKGHRVYSDNLYGNGSAPSHLLFI